MNREVTSVFKRIFSLFLTTVIIVLSVSMANMLLYKYISPALFEFASHQSTLAVRAPAQPVTDELLKQMQTQIKDKYNVQVLFGPETPLVYGIEYDNMTAATEMYERLYLIDNELSRYPEGFFRVWEDINDHNPLQILLVNKITSIQREKKDPGEEYLGVYTGSHVILYTQKANRETLHHEIGHGIDYILRISDYAQNNGVHFDRTEWDSFLPSGFEYGAATGSSTPKYVYSAISKLNDIYFLDVYSTTAIEEHVATIFACSMLSDLARTPKRIQALASPHIQDQMRYYFSLIRETFDDEGWAEIPCWEKSLVF